MDKPEQKGEMQEMMSPRHRAEMLRMHHAKGDGDVRGVSFPWTLVLATLAGAWLMAAPGVLPPAKKRSRPEPHRRRAGGHRSP